MVREPIHLSDWIQYLISIDKTIVNTIENKSFIQCPHCQMKMPQG